MDQHAEEPVDGGEAGVHPDLGARRRLVALGSGVLAHSHATTSSTISSTRPVGGVDDPGPVGHAQGRRRPGAVEPVTAGQGVRALLRPAPGPLVGGGGEVDLDVGVGEDHRADVPALDHPAPPLGHPLPLALHQHRPHRRVGRHRRHRPAHLGAADGLGHVGPVHLHPVADLDGRGPGPARPRRPGPTGRWPGRGRPRPPPGTWRRCPAGRPPAGRPGPETRSTCPIRPARRWR